MAEEPIPQVLATLGVLWARAWPSLSNDVFLLSQLLTTSAGVLRFCALDLGLHFSLALTL